MKLVKGGTKGKFLFFSDVIQQTNESELQVERLEPNLGSLNPKEEMSSFCMHDKAFIDIVTFYFVYHY